MDETSWEIEIDSAMTYEEMIYEQTDTNIDQSEDPTESRLISFSSLLSSPAGARQVESPQVVAGQGGSVEQSL